MSLSEPTPADVRRALDRVRIVAVVDGVLLLVLLFCAFTDREGAINVLGPVHGVGFLALLYLTATGAANGRWGWWFPVVTAVTAGPPGSLYGDQRIRRELRRR